MVTELAVAVRAKDDAEGREGNKSELRVWLRMLSVTKLVSQEIRRRLRSEFGVTLPQFDLMAQLYREPGGLRLGEISKRTMVTNGNITGLVVRLEQEGLIRRETPGDDRRVKVARLTTKGSEAFVEMAKQHQAWLKELMEDVDESTLSALISNIDALQASAKRHFIDDTYLADESGSPLPD
jgi:DNA-binding MarR family transcriptional regulator